MAEREPCDGNSGVLVTTTVTLERESQVWLILLELSERQL